MHVDASARYRAQYERNPEIIHQDSLLRPSSVVWSFLLMEIDTRFKQAIDRAVPDGRVERIHNTILHHFAILGISRTDLCFDEEIKK